MKKNSFKILNPTARHIRRAYGVSVLFLFDQTSFKANPSYPLLSGSVFTSLSEVLPISSFSSKKENKAKHDLTPVKKQPKKFSNQLSWLQPRNPNSYNSSKRFWNSLEVTLQPVLKEKRIEAPDLWKSFTSTPRISPKKVQTDSCNISFYTEPCQSAYTSIESTPQRPSQTCYSSLPDLEQRKMFRAKRK